MLKINSTNTNFNAVSAIDETTLASFSASTNEPDNNAYISISIDNMRAFKENLAIVDADITAFIDTVMGVEE